MKTKRILIDPTLCSGCRACEAVCSGWHEHRFGPSLARIHVVKREELGIDRPITCLQCTKAPCVTSCPVQALSRDPLTGAVRVDGDACIGCGLCVDSCVNGSMSLHPDTSHALVCDLCDGDPQCVAVCPTGALLYGAPELVGARKRERTALTGLRKEG